MKRKKIVDSIPKKPEVKVKPPVTTKRPPKRPLFYFLIILFAVLLIVLGSIGLAKAYDEKIYPKITIAGVKVGGLTRLEAKTALEEKLNQLNTNGPEIIYDSQTFKPSLNDMGVTFNVDEAIQQAYLYGRNGAFQNSIQEKILSVIKGYAISLEPKINNDQFDLFVKTFSQSVDAAPVNAGLSYQNGQIVASQAKNGRGIDQNKLKQDLTDFINNKKNNRIVVEVQTLQPKIADSGILDAQKTAQNYLTLAPIKVTYNDRAWEADINEIGSWLRFQEKESTLVTSADPAGFVNGIAKSIEVSKIDREIEEGTNAVLREGRDGLAVDKNTLTSQIKDALSSGTVGASFSLITTVIPHSDKTVSPHAQPGRYPGHYIDVNLSEQRLYAFDGTNQVNTFLVSTGKRGYATPTGEFHVYGKSRYALMDGPDYYLPNVPWVTWFYGDYSIHGTYWHHNFGHVMSHGCVNASTPDAEWVYNFVEIGTPVYIHY